MEAANLRAAGGGTAPANSDVIGAEDISGLPGAVVDDDLVRPVSPEVFKTNLAHSVTLGGEDVDEDDHHADAFTRSKTKIVSLFENLMSSVQSANVGKKYRDQLVKLRYLTGVADERAACIFRQGEKSWQLSALSFIHSNRCQIFLIVLLLLDVIIVVVELFIEAQFPHCNIITRDAISCVPAACAPSTASHRLLASAPPLVEYTSSSPSFLASLGATAWYNYGRRLGGGGGHATCSDSSLVPVSSFEATCDDHKYATLHTLHYVLMSLSVLILLVFLVELLTLLLCLGSAFCKNALYVLDLFVVSLSLTVEITMWRMAATGWDGVTVVILSVRIWRFVRVVHGLFSSVHERTEMWLTEVEDNCHKLKANVDELVKENEKLKRRLKKWSDADPQ